MSQRRARHLFLLRKIHNPSVQKLRKKRRDAKVPPHLLFNPLEHFLGSQALVLNLGEDLVEQPGLFRVGIINGRWFPKPFTFIFRWLISLVHRIALLKDIWGECGRVGKQAALLVNLPQTGENCPVDCHQGSVNIGIVNLGNLCLKGNHEE